MKKNNTAQELKQIIDNSNNLLVISHILPDGDNIGSVIAMKAVLEQLGKRVTAVVNGQLPPYYRFLEGAEELVPIDGRDTFECDCLICLDMSDEERGGSIWEKLSHTGTVINIDHHISNTFFGDYHYVFPEACSTAEIVTDLFSDWQVSFDKAIAEALYVGMLTDSGNFTYTNTSSHSLQMAAILLKQKIDFEKIRENVFENAAFVRKKILAKVLEQAELLGDGRLCVSYINNQDITALQAKGPDFEGIIDHLIGINGVEFAIFYREIQPREVKVGFRARGGFDATKVAGQFGGGGHKAASGCSCNGDLKEIIENINNAAIRHLKEQ